VVRIKKMSGRRKILAGIALAGLLVAFPADPGLAKRVLREGRKVRKAEAQRMDLQAAEAAVAAKDYDAALGLYQTFLQDFPESDRVALAHEKMGEVYFLQENFPAALGEFQFVVHNFPTRPEAVEANWGLALTAYKLEDFSQAAAAGKSLFPRMHSGERKDKVAMLVAECEVRLNYFVEAVSWYSRVAREGDDPALKENARSQALKLIESRLSTAELENLLQTETERFPAEPALKQLALKAYENGDLELSQSALDRLLRQFPNSDFGDQARELLEKLSRRKKVDPGRIGVILPLSGPRALVGQKALQGIALAADIFGGAQNPYPLELCVRDSAEDPAQAARAVEELVLDEHVIAILGPLVRSASEAAAAKAQELEVPIILLSPLENFSYPEGAVFLDCLTKAAQVSALLDWAMGEKKLSRFAVLYPGDSYGLEYSELFAAEVIRRQGTVVNKVDYPPGQTDFTPDILRLVGLSAEQLRKYRAGKSGPPLEFEALFIPDAGNVIAMLAPQLRFHKVTGIQLLGINSWHSEELLRQTKPEDLAGAVFADTFAPELNESQFVEFDYRFRKTYGEPATLIETQAFEAMAVSLHLIRDLHVENRTQFTQALHQVRDYPQVLGPITVQPSGEWKKPLVLFTFKDGRLEVVERKEE